MLATKCEVVLLKGQKACRVRLLFRPTESGPPPQETFMLLPPDPTNHPDILTRLMRQLRLRDHKLDQGCRVQFMEEDS